MFIARKPLLLTVGLLVIKQGHWNKDNRVMLNME